MKKTKRIIVLTILFFLILASVILCGKRVEKYHRAELIENLRVVTDRNAANIEQSIEEYQNALRGMAVEVGTYLKEGSSMDGILEVLYSLNEIYGFKRVGFVDTDGYAMMRDGKTRYLKGEPFFIEGMKGNAYISEVLVDQADGEPVNIISVPVYASEEAGGSTVGVIFVIYNSQELTHRIDSGVAVEMGYCVIIDESGQVMMVSENRRNLQVDDNLLDRMREASKHNLDAVEAISFAIRKNTSDNLQYYTEDGKLQHMYFRPLWIDNSASNWYIGTVASKEIIEEEMRRVTRPIWVLMVWVIVLTALAFAFFIVDTKSQQKAQRAQLEYLAYTDPVTLGSNYIKFKEQLAGYDVPGYLVSTNIRAFKIVNSVCGVGKGDEVLRAIWKIIDKHLVEHDLAGHISADYFVIFFTTEDTKIVEQKLLSIHDDVTRMTKKANVPQARIYFGVAKWKPGDRVEKTYSDANVAREQIRNREDAIFAFFSEENMKRLIEEKDMENSFENALASHAFEVWEQPKFDPDNNRVVGAEALVRWRRPDGSLVSPGMFIPLFEKNGMIRILDEYVFREVCKLQHRRKMQGKSMVPISVNLSRASLYFPNIVQVYKDITVEIGVDCALVPIEITESAAVDNVEIKDLAKDFVDAGFVLHMDDFGAGYSSLSALNTMPFDTLKLDKSLIDYIGAHGGECLLNHTIHLAKELGMHVTAEGVESEEQVSFLKKQKCDSIQGFFFSKPLRQDEFEELLDKMNEQ